MPITDTTRSQPMSQDPVYAFQLSTFRQALDEWKQEQIEAYPQQTDLIETVALAMEDFMQSSQVIKHKMTISSSNSRNE